MHLQLVSTPAPRLFDEESDTIRAIETALEAPASCLQDERRRVPGAYLLLYRGTMSLYRRLRRPDESALGSITCDGGYPIYVGSALDLAERARRHQRKAEALLEPGALLFVGLATASLAGGVYAERILIDQFRPVWNQPWLAGWGSKRQGRTRTASQKPSPWAALHHPSVEGLSQRVALGVRVERYLCETVGSFAPVAPGS